MFRHADPHTRFAFGALSLADPMGPPPSVVRGRGNGSKGTPGLLGLSRRPADSLPARLIGRSDSRQVNSPEILDASRGPDRETAEWRHAPRAGGSSSDNRKHHVGRGGAPPSQQVKPDGLPGRPQNHCTIRVPGDRIATSERIQICSPPIWGSTRRRACGVSCSRDIGAPSPSQGRGRRSLPMQPVGKSGTLLTQWNSRDRLAVHRRPRHASTAPARCPRHIAPRHAPRTGPQENRGR